MKTNTVSNTAFRGFGGPQGLITAERIMEEIAYALGKDPLEVRRANFYGDTDRNVTPYHQTVTDNIIGRIVDELVESSDYAARREAVIAHNAKGGIIRKGIALTPVKFGISFTATWYNQAGALVHVYNDGSVHLNHGGTEMGQGLNTKVSQVVADVFQIDLDRVKITATTTAKVPNTSATAASSGSDLNGMAAQNAAEQIRDRLIDFAAEKYSVDREQVVFEPNRVLIGNRRIAFDDLIKEAYLGRVHLSAAGFYKTPEIHWDRAAGKGRPFYYFAYGAAVSEVSVDTLTGEYHVDRTDILHDVGRSLNPAIDKGQVEGAFIQGIGWLTTEELWWDDKGRLRTHAPSTYKIPLASDRPAIFNVKLADWSVNREPTIRRSKAVGEPPFMLGVSVLEALSMAVASVPTTANARASTPRRRPSACCWRSSGWQRRRHDRPPRNHRPLPRRREPPPPSSASRPPAARPRASAAPGWRSAPAPRSAPSAAASSSTWRSTPPAPCSPAARTRRPSTSRSAPRSASAAAAAPSSRSPASTPPAGSACAPSPRPSAGRSPRSTSSAPATSAARSPRRWRCCRCAPSSSTAAPRSCASRRPASTRC